MPRSIEGRFSTCAAFLLLGCSFIPSAIAALPSAGSPWLCWSNLQQPALQYSSRLWQTDEGLPNNRVQALTQTADGNLWVGTSDGLAEFDGVDFTTCAYSSLRHASITSLFPSSDGALWIGTKAGGLGRIYSNQFSLFMPENGLAGKSLRFLAQSPDGAIWIGTTRGLSRYSHGRFQTFAGGRGFLPELVTGLCQDQQGAMWIGTAKGLYRMQDGVVKPFNAAGALENGFIHALWLDKNERLWIGTDHGLFCYAAGVLQVYTTADGLADNFVNAICEDRQTNLWVGTSSGLSGFFQGRFQTMLDDNGVPYDQVNAIMEDTRGDLWIGSREGLIRLARKPFSVITVRQGLSYNNLTSVLEDGRHRLWVGTWGGGLDEITATGVFVYGKTNHFLSNQIKALCEAHDGAIWAGADNDGGLFRIDGRRVTHYGVRDGLIDGTISVLYEDQESNLWIGTRLGLCRLRQGKFLHEMPEQNRPVWAICEDTHGRLWCGGDAGLFTRTDGVFSNVIAGGVFPAGSISALYADPQGEVWIGTRAEGLMRWRGNELARYGTKNGLYSDEILGIAEDHGWLWMTSTKGISRVRRRSLETLKNISTGTMPCITYGKADGLESIVCGDWSAPTIWKTADDRMCFATTIGLAVIDARNIRVDLSPPPVYIVEIDVDRKPVHSTGGSIIIPPSRGELDIRYTALDLRAPEKCRFKYRLEHVDNDWIDADTHRTAHYSNVGPGDYRFRVLACNKDGIWNESGAAVALELRPHYWQTKGFNALALAALLGMAGGSARFITQRKMQRRLESAERRHTIEKERGRIAKDIHDDLGSSLTRIMLLGLRAESDLAERKEVGPHLAKIVNFSRSTIQAMDEIVWAVNPSNDNLDGLVGYLNEYAAQLFQDAKIRCRLQMPISSQLNLRTEVRHDLYLAFKEALNNVLKHSHASEVHIKVSNVESAVSISIADNGRGFELAENGNGVQGNGLQNMRKRMSAIGGHLKIITAPAQGTKVEFTVHVAPLPAN